ncbi:M14 family zinc carboxypeptidase [Iodidimonas nitroreducens]|uniref:M14 family zinc carboxypeptidase n=1 Tax=Iodidimonas nitroreducens TaxID=1236968 RepID=UPI0028D271EF|nr:M14 family zinc carboxypeptidase [Iodidimonas nitroreducens]
MPVVTWLNYGVHGAEASGMDAAIPVVYHLAAAQDEETVQSLEGSIILITAIFNPDGHARRIDHVYKYGSVVPVTDPAHAAHDLWVDARTNHYWFDLNRQWLLQTQPESKAWLAKWHEWKPNVTVDYHEMGSNSTYYFHPGEPQRKNPLIPDRSRDLLKQMAGYHAKSLDQDGTLYFTEEGFDNYYIGKGSTYPHINGSIGILFEAGAARGGAIDTPNGLRTHGENIRKHFRTSLSSIRGALGLKPDLLAYQAQFHQDAMAKSKDDPIKGWVYSSPDQARMRLFTDLLARHQIKSHELARTITIDTIAYRAGEAVIVPMAQTQYHMIKGIFERVRSFEEAVFYDVSGWTLPLAYDLDHASLDRKNWRDDLIGAPAMAKAESAPVPDRAPYGYAFEWTDHYAPKALYRLLDAGLRVRGAVEPFSAITTKGIVDFPRGSLFVPLAGQDHGADAIHRLVASVAADEGIAVHAISSGLTPTVGADLGGRNSFESLEKPKVLLLFDAGISKYEAGEAWFLLDHEMHIPVTLRAKDDLRGLDWSVYSHIILPGGNAALDERSTQRLGQWISEEGGTLIALRQGALWAQKSFLTAADRSTENQSKEGKAGGAKAEEAGPKRLDYADFPVAEAKDVIGGAIFGSDLDITHPMAFGYSDRLISSHRNITRTLAVPANPYAQIARYLEAQPLLSGYASDRRIKDIAGTPMMLAERKGAGSIIAIADAVNFRGIFLGTSKLFLNGLFWSKAFQSPRNPDEMAENSDSH